MPLGTPMLLPGGHPGSAGYHPPSPPHTPPVSGYPGNDGYGGMYTPGQTTGTGMSSGAVGSPYGGVGSGAPNQNPMGGMSLPGGHPGSPSYPYGTPSPGAGGGFGGLPNLGNMDVALYGSPNPNYISPEQQAAQAQYAAYQQAIQDQLAALGAGNSYNQQFYASQQALEQANTLANQNYMTQGAGYDRSLLEQDRYRTVDIGNERLANLTASELADYQRNTGNLAPLRGYIAQGYTNQLASNQLAHDTNYRTTSSDAIARGAIGSNGVNTNLGEIDTSLSNANNDASLTRDKGLTALQQRQADYDAAHKTALQDEATQQEFISSLAKDFGVRGEQIDAALKHGLEQLGYDAAKTQAALAQAAQSSSSAAAAQAAALAQQAIALGLQNPNTPPPPAPGQTNYGNPTANIPGLGHVLNPPAPAPTPPPNPHPVTGAWHPPPPPPHHTTTSGNHAGGHGAQ